MSQVEVTNSKQVSKSTGRVKNFLFYTLFALSSLIASDLLLLLMGASFGAISSPLTWLSTHYPDNNMVPTIGVPATCAAWTILNWLIGAQFTRRLGELAGVRQRNATILLTVISCSMIIAFGYFLSITTVSNPLAAATGANKFSKLGVTLIGLAANICAQLFEAWRVCRSRNK